MGRGRGTGKKGGRIGKGEGRGVRREGMGGHPQYFGLELPLKMTYSKSACWNAPVNDEKPRSHKLTTETTRVKVMAFEHARLFMRSQI